MSRYRVHRVLTVLIALVWIGFGLVCKVLELVPRHAEIVARILGPSHADSITRLIGVLEVLMGVWVLSRHRRRWAAIVQIALVGVMNLLETVLAPDLLLWGRFNAFFALGLMAVIYVNEWLFGGSEEPERAWRAG
jgi:hypothetical protein